MDKWKMKDGEYIEVKDMTTQHIKNTMKAIEENRISFAWSSGYDGEDFAYDDGKDEQIYWLKTFKEELDLRERIDRAISERLN